MKRTEKEWFEWYRKLNEDFDKVSDYNKKQYGRYLAYRETPVYIQRVDQLPANK